MRDLNYYMGLPYTVVLRRDEDGDFVARVDELQGCSAHGKTPAEALESLEEAKALWITDCLEAGDTVPEPTSEDQLPSGKWLQRVPRSLHRKLASLARREGVSLNQLVTFILSEAAGARHAAAAHEPWSTPAKSWAVFLQAFEKEEPTIWNISELQPRRRSASLTSVASALHTFAHSLSEQPDRVPDTFGHPPKERTSRAARR